jgi:hypothetical protein
MNSSVQVQKALLANYCLKRHDQASLILVCCSLQLCFYCVCRVRNRPSNAAGDTTRQTFSNTDLSITQPIVVMIYPVFFTDAESSFIAFENHPVEPKAGTISNQHSLVALEKAFDSLLIVNPSDLTTVVDFGVLVFLSSDFEQFENKRYICVHEACKQTTREVPRVVIQLWVLFKLSLGKALCSEEHCADWGPRSDRTYDAFKEAT